MGKEEIEIMVEALREISTYTRGVFGLPTEEAVIAIIALDKIGVSNEDS
jgi:hypothetical protein